MRWSLLFLLAWIHAAQDCHAQPATTENHAAAISPELIDDIREFAGDDNLVFFPRKRGVIDGIDLYIYNNQQNNILSFLKERGVHTLVSRLYTSPALSRQSCDILKEMHNLKVVTFRKYNNKLPPFLIDSVSHSRNLYFIGFYECNVGVDDIKQIACINTLYHVELVKCGVSGAHLHELRACKELRSVTLQGNPLASIDISELRECKKIRWLDLSDTKCDDDVFQYLDAFEHLEAIDLSQTLVTKEKLKFFKDSLDIKAAKSRVDVPRPVPK